jgi:ribosomal protein S18 acetylase RimI-like enzyme
MLTQAVTSAAPAEREHVVSTIVLAFVRDPIARWVWRDPHGYLDHFPPFVDAFGGRAFSSGSAHRTGDGLGAALWLPPEVRPDEDTMVALIERTVDAARLPTVYELFEHMGRHHPAEPHWYLPLIGVDPLMQGRGYGSALLQRTLEQIDQERRVAYLESTNPLNVPLYRRHGFEIAGTIQVADAPPMIPMVRPAR